MISSCSSFAQQALCCNITFSQHSNLFETSGEQLEFTAATPWTDEDYGSGIASDMETCLRGESAPALSAILASLEKQLNKAFQRKLVLTIRNIQQIFRRFNFIESLFLFRKDVQVLGQGRYHLPVGIYRDMGALNVKIRTNPAR